MIELINTILKYLASLPQNLDHLFAQSGLWPYLILWVNLFLETGGLVFNFLPGNSLVLAASAFAANSDQVSILILTLIFVTSTFLGDLTSFMLGRFFGKKYQKQTRIRFINQDHFETAHEYFETNGKRTLIVSRFIPIFRGILPFAAGFSQTDPQTILPFLASGALLWNLVYISVGFIFGNLPIVQENFTLLIGAVILLTMIPTFFIVLYNFRKFKKSVQEKALKRSLSETSDLAASESDAKTTDDREPKNKKIKTSQELSNTTQEKSAAEDM